MRAAFEFQSAIHVFAINQGDNFLESADAERVLAHDFHFPAAPFGVARIHAEQISGKERGLVAARPCANFQHDIFFVVRVFRNQQRPQFLVNLLHAGLQFVNFIFG